MRTILPLAVALLVSLAAVAQDSPQLSAEEAAFQKVTQLAALTHYSTVFSHAWTDYVVNHVRDSAGIEPAIERVMQAATAFRQEFRAGHSGSGGPPLGYFEMRNLLQGIAEEALADKDD